MSGKPKLKGSKTFTPDSKTARGKYRWSIEYKNGSVMDKYNEDGSKNVYAGREDAKAKVYVPLKDATAIALTDAVGNVVAAMEVPDGAVVFQRRRVRDVNYYNRFHNVEETIPGGMSSYRWIPERKITKVVPEYTYGELWLIGWRRREANGSVTVHYNCVFPDGKVDEHDSWTPNGWRYEPEWLPEEVV